MSNTPFVSGQQAHSLLLSIEDDIFQSAHTYIIPEKAQKHIRNKRAFHCLSIALFIGITTYAFWTHHSIQNFLIFSFIFGLVFWGVISFINDFNRFCFTYDNIKTVVNRLMREQITTDLPYEAVCRLEVLGELCPIFEKAFLKNITIDSQHLSNYQKGLNLIALYSNDYFSFSPDDFEHFELVQQNN